MDFKSIIFDLDGTLIDSMNVWCTIDDEFLSGFGIEKPSDFNENMKVMSFTQAADYFRDKLNVPLSSDEIKKRWHEMAERKYSSTVPLKPGVMEFVTTQHNKGVRMCVATANHEYLTRIALTRLGIMDYMDFILTCDDVSFGKDTPEIYLKAARRLDTNPSETVVFEDALHGILSAKSAGFYVVGVSDEVAAADIDEIKKNCNIFISDYKELL